MEERFGFIHEEFDIKILILYILRRLPEKIPFEDLAELTLCDEGISYFEFAECLASLVESGHIASTDDQYAITPKGGQNGEALESNLPYSVRIKAEKATSVVALIQKRNELIRASHTVRSRGGCTVNLSMSDGIGTLMKLELLAGSEEQAARLERNFKADAENLYGRIVALLSGEEDRTK